MRYPNFETTEEFKEWFLNLSEEEQIYTCKQILTVRKMKESLKYAPTQVELRSKIGPSIVTFKKLFPDYGELCAELGYINKFNYISRPIIGSMDSFCNRIGEAPPTVLVDSREKNPYCLRVPTKKTALKFGDYCLEHPTCKPQVFIERKSVTDFLGSFSYGFKRVEREIIRAQQAGAYVVVLVEELLGNVLDYRTKLDLPPKVKTDPQQVFRNVRKLCQRYSNLQFLFAGDHEDSSLLTLTILYNETLAPSYDLQLLFDENNL